MTNQTHIQVRDDHTIGRFLRRTVAAQIHALGLVAAVVGTVFLLRAAATRAVLTQTWVQLGACAAFSFSAILVFATSAVFHFLHDGLRISPRLEAFLERCDHFAIYLFIAGTYTPVVLNNLLSPWREAMLIAIWAIAFVGISYTAFKARLPRWAQHRLVYTGLFVLMGWLAVARIGSIMGALSLVGKLGFLLGALSYTLGAVVYASKRPRLFEGVFGFHELWHVMVLLGFACHYVMILDFYR